MAEIPSSVVALAADIACPTKLIARKSLSKADFNRIFENGRRANGTYCRITTLAGEGRFGFATTKSIGCHARRNRLKRRLREAVKKIGLDSIAQFDVIISGNQSADNVRFSELCIDVEQTLRAAYARWDEN